MFELFHITNEEINIIQIEIKKNYIILSCIKKCIDKNTF